jgi:anti-sigma regulatory factor (Ser/Thr protein kinase)
VAIRSRSLPPQPQSSLAARRFLREVAAGRLPPQMLDSASLLTSELVSNAVRHAKREPGDEMQLTVSVENLSVRVGVQDTGPGFDPEHLPEPTAGSGWGLRLVDAVSSRWGVTRGAAGTEVWFEIRRDIADFLKTESEKEGTS